MAQAGPNGVQVEQHDTLYTALLIISAAILLVGIVFIVTRSYQLFGSLWPTGTAA